MTTPHATPHLFTIEELSAHLGLSVGTLRNWRVEGRGPRAAVIGGRLRWRPEDVAAWVGSQVESHVGA